MAKIPINFKRVAAAFDEAARWRRPCESSSGSEYWPESGTSLSDLVNSFLEKGDHRDEDHFDFDHHHHHVVEINYNKDRDNNDDDENDDNWVSDNDEDNYNVKKELLGGLLLACEGDDSYYGVKQKLLHDEIEVALIRLMGDYYTNNNNTYCSTSRNGLKRSLMAHLRDKGFDAGLCKSRWEKTGRFSAGTYEYIDVNIDKTRYIIEVFLAREFEIARPTTRYTSLLGMIPSILIIEKQQVLKQIMRLMCDAMKESLKHVDMHVAPWRRYGYMQAKYFSPYKRTTNRETKVEKEGVAKKRSIVIGFEEILDLPRISYKCKVDDFSSKAGVRVGLLAAAFHRSN